MSSSLAHAIRINDQIRQIIEASRQVNYVALNALLTARKAGSRSLGFAVVARHLRSLARDMEQSMGQLDEVIMRLVRSIAAQLNDGRMLHYAQRAESACDVAPACMARMLAALGQRVDAWEEGIERDWIDLWRHFTQAVRLSEMGGILSRNARIEAAHGGEMAAQLIQVSNQIEENVDSVSQRLRALRVLINDRGSP